MIERQFPLPMSRCTPKGRVRSLVGTTLLASLFWLLLVSPVLAAGVIVDDSEANQIAKGDVLKADPQAARIRVRNNYQFWVAVAFDNPVGEKRSGDLQIKPVGSDDITGSLYASLGLIGPGSHAAWQGTFGPGSVLPVWVHYSKATTLGSTAASLTVLSIAANSFGPMTLTGSAVSAAMESVNKVPEFLRLVELLQASGEGLSPWEFVKTWTLLFQNPEGRIAVATALSKLGVTVAPTDLIGLNQMWALPGFLETLFDLGRAGIGKHTSGVVRFSVPGTVQTKETTTTTLAPTTTEPAEPKPAPASPMDEQDMIELVSPGWGISAAQLEILAYEDFGEWSAAVVSGADAGRLAVFRWTGDAWILYWLQTVTISSDGFAVFEDPNSLGSKGVPQKVIDWLNLDL